MNRAYRLVWSAVRDVWIPVAETARGRSRRASRTLLAATLTLGAAMAQAGGPSGGQVTAGSASIAQSGALTTITQHSATLSLSWSSFNIAPQDTVDFVQPSPSAIAVNRIFATNGTQILGHLNANGQVYLINPNGIVFGPGAEVNVGGLVATTLELDPVSLEGNARSFSASGAANSSDGVVNEGTISAAPGGYVALLGSHVGNQGVINAQLGSVALAAGSAVTLSFGGSGLLHLQVDQSVWHSLAENSGLIHADGGQVTMSAGARDAVVASVVNNSGVIEARTVDAHEGTITLLGGETAGTVKVGGTLDASAPEGGNGGSIETSAAHVEVAASARVTTAAAAGHYGSWLIDPQDFTIAASGGDITGAALSTELNTTPVVIQSSAGATAGSGNVNVNDAVSWSANTGLTLTASNNVDINANIAATGNSAGLVINPNTANGAESASGTGTYTLLAGASITLSGTTPSLSIAGIPYTVINSLGAAGSTTGTDLQGINGALGGHYALGSNIDASATSGWNAGAGFTPLGSNFFVAGQSFSGVFDGLGHIISNLTINLPATNSVALFGAANGNAVIQNVGMVGGSIAGADYVGGLVGFNHGTVADSYATGSVTGGSYSFFGGSHHSVGGLVGFSYGVISGSHANGAVNGDFDVGGLVGTDSGTLSTSYATGAVTGVIGVGGLVGYFAVNGHGDDLYASGAVVGGSNVGGLVGLSQGALSDSYATGAVNGSGANIGGLVGSNENGTITNSYATGAVSGAANVGGLISVGAGGSVSNSFWNTTTSGQATSGGGTGLTTTQMQTASNFGGFNFTTTPGAAGNNWVMVDADGSLNNAGGASGATYPMLASEYSTIVTNAHQLQLMAMNVAASYTLGQNIDASATGLAASSGSSDIWSTSGGFVPIGSVTSMFNGVFDGAGHSINDLTIDLPGVPYVGLFSAASNIAVIQNVGIVGGSVAGSAYVGGMVGFNDATISNSYVTGAVSALNGKVGGLVGNNGGTISNSYATGSVTGSTYSAGGLVGLNVGTITASHASGAVSAGSGYGAGGLVGDDAGVISNSYATGTVSGGTRVGGLAGIAATEGVLPITDSYATGAVTGVNDVGGLVGLNYFAVSGSFATGPVAGTAAVGGLVGRNYGTIATSYASGAVSGSSYVGGLVGLNHYGAVSNSYATGGVSGTNETGGLVGHNYSGATISNSYATGSVTGSGNAVGGLVGQNDGAVSGSFWNTDIAAIGIGGGSATGATGLGSAALMTIAPFSAAGWSISDTGGSGLVWRIYQDSTAPLLLSFLAPLTVTADNSSQMYDAAIVGATGLHGASYSVAGAPGSGHLFNSSDAYAGVINVGSYTPTLYSDQQGYDISYVGSTLTIAPATLTETATPASRIYGQANPSLSGSLTGFVGGDTLANATSGALVWTTTAVAASEPGHYAIDGGGLTAMNYLFVEAAGNATALTVQPGTGPVIPPITPPVIPPLIPPGFEGPALEAQTAAASLDELLRTRKLADAVVPALRIVRGGVKLPAELADADAH